MMKIGYSCWGFLGKGIVDTPDGGRSHRPTLIKGLLKNSQVIMLQSNRDLIEANEKINWKNLSFDLKFPILDAIFFEYRWEIPGRNCLVDINNPMYTTDYDRQLNLFDYYEKKNIPILIWDKDQKIINISKIPKNSVVFESALSPNFKHLRLLFPIDIRESKKALKNLSNYSSLKKKYDLAYVGNQYERDESFKKYIDIPASVLNNKVYIYGNWSKYPQTFINNKKLFPNVYFKKRILYERVKEIYNNTFATVLLAPDRYYKTGQLTQRIFESLWGQCIPLLPSEYDFLEDIIDNDFRVSSSEDVIKKIKNYRNLDNKLIKHKLNRQIKKLIEIYNPHPQIQQIYQTINDLKSA